MIKKGRTVIELGTGDIRLCGGLTTDHIGVAALLTTEPGEIGRTADPFDIDDAEVIMAFSNIKSLDQIILDLNLLRDLMLENETKEAEQK